MYKQEKAYYCAVCVIDCSIRIVYDFISVLGSFTVCDFTIHYL